MKQYVMESQCVMDLPAQLWAVKLSNNSRADGWLDDRLGAPAAYQG
jgi:hypothetical protein